MRSSAVSFNQLFRLGEQVRTRINFVWASVVLIAIIAVGTQFVLLWPASVAAAQPPKFFKIGIVTDAMVPWHTSTEEFRDGLKKFGYVEGKNLAFEARSTQGDSSRLPKLAAELMVYGPNLSEFYRHAAYFVDRILKGTKPADLPVERPKKYELIINLQSSDAN